MNIDTLAARAQHEFVVKQSRFLATAQPIDSIADATDVLADARRVEATHHCWAWRLGDGYRSSDDGEPAGTAGRPILAAIDGQGFDRVVVVVMRWYGGINLGAGGLVRAYGGCAAECLRAAPRHELVAMTDIQIAFGFEDTGAVRALLEVFDASAVDQTFDAGGARVRVRLRADAVEPLKARLRDATRDRARVSLAAALHSHDTARIA